MCKHPAVSKKPARPRTARRVEERAARGLVRDRDQAARLLPGHTPGRPIRLESVAILDRRAAITPCPQCGGELKAGEHAAVVVDGARLRRVDMKCQQCGTSRSLWFSVEPPLPN